MERLISPQPVSWPRLHLIPVSTWHPLVCAASQNPDKPGVKTQAAALAANGAAQISTCRSSAPLRGGAAGARGIDPIFWGEALTLGCSRSLPRSCSENLTFRATRGLPGVAEPGPGSEPRGGPAAPGAHLAAGAAGARPGSSNRAAFVGSDKGPKKGLAANPPPARFPRGRFSPRAFSGEFPSPDPQKRRSGHGDAFQGAAAPPRAGHGPGSSGEASGHLGELLGWHQNCPGCPWECSGPCLCSLPLRGHGSFISGC